MHGVGSALLNITAGITFGVFPSAPVIPVHCTVHTEALALLDLSLLFKLCWPVVLQAMKWLDQDSQWQFDQTGSGHWSRAGETEIVGNTLGSTLGTSVD